MGSFFNYVDKKRWVGDTENVNDMQIFPNNSRRIHSPITTGGR